ncbi:DUF5050 domain-containing protein [Lutispora sp.]|uniref:DUF5050 domain-containing protein n=1 Tax=Lutispora sp. TaxID=2828727 RepID=UPI002B1F4F03|nr:DUF5050 domain-containing protein [Lutispora sp.]MEA4962438.1 DUF5050 domain-containing protein [Lutispora sp.]
MRRIVIIAIILCFSINFTSCSLAQKQDSLGNDRNNIDNSVSGNINLTESADAISYTNDGYVSNDEDWIYYSDNYLYRIKKNGSIKENLFDDLIVGEIFLTRDWIYFTGMGDINKIKFDGSQLTRIDRISADNLIFKDDWIYLRDEIEGDIYRMREDGKDKVKLVDGYVNSFCSDENFIYYVSRFIYRVKPDGTDETILSDEATTNSNISISGEWIYFANENDNNKLYKIRKDGTGLIKISDDQICFVKATKDWIYYIIRHDYYATEPTLDKICRIKTDGSQYEEIPHFSRGELKSLAVIGDWIYYRELTDSDQYSIYRVKIDGSNTNVPNNGQCQDKFPMIVTTSPFLEQNGIEYMPKPDGEEQFTTLWVEGAKGSGIGEWIKLESGRIDANGKKTAMTQTINGIQILNGHIKSKELYFANNRVKKIQIEFSDGSSIIKELDDEFAEYDKSFGEYFGVQEIFFDREIDTDYIKISILDVYRGNKYDDTCISGIQIF